MPTVLIGEGCRGCKYKGLEVCLNRRVKIMACADFEGEIKTKVDNRCLRYDQSEGPICSICGIPHLDCSHGLIADMIVDGPEKAKERFELLGQEIGRLTDEKNEAYGDMLKSANPVMHALYPNGVKPEQLNDMLLMVRIVDKLSRIACGNRQAFGENPWKDIAGYSLIGVLKEGK